MDHPAETAIPIDGSNLQPTSTHTRTINITMHCPEVKHILKSFVLFLVLTGVFVPLAALVVGFITSPRAQSEIFVKPESSLTFSNMTIASNMVITVKNPSKHLSLKYTDIQVGVVFRDNFLCRTSMQSFSQVPGKETTVSAALHCITSSEDLEVDFARGEVDTEVILLTSVQFRPWWIFYQPSFLCSSVMFTNSSKGGQSMMYAMASESC